VKTEIRVPSVGESVSQGTIATWLSTDGQYVEEGADLYELETDKATVTVPAPASGVLSISSAAGTDVQVGTVVGYIDTEAQVAPRPQAAEGRPGKQEATPAGPPPAPESREAPILSPSARRIVEESGLKAGEIQGSGRGGRITKEDALKAAARREEGGRTEQPAAPEPEPAAAPSPRTSGAQRRVPLSTIRKRTAEKLVEAQRNTAYLTTFNEADMGKVRGLRGRFREEFERDHGVKLGLVSFFVKACCLALKEFPEVNAKIEGDDVVYSDRCHIGVAVSTERGLLVPVVRDADGKSLAELETAIADLAGRARNRKILPDELAGGTFSITNGGVFGSLLSTPLPNYPQTAILGMHAIQDRPVAVDGRVEIKPMMYLALSYDHRLIDGRDAVRFLRRVKELVEDPDRLLLEV
jgi:2-oxoglutarate dehydrogenase E2 component (dihydrolipoamide succinyltransferase)